MCLDRFLTCNTENATNKAHKGKTIKQKKREYVLL